MERYLEAFGHDTLLVRHGQRSGLQTIVAVHSVARGPALGGCRMWTYEDSRAAVRDGLRLSRAMTFKNAVAGLPLGGGKGVIMLNEGHAPLSAERRRAALLDFAETVDLLGGRYLTAEDVGTSEPDMNVIAERTPHVTGLAVERGGSGDPSPWTALGVEVAIRATCERAFGSPSLEGRSIAVLGVGNVGGRLARLLAAGGAKLILADIVEERRALAEELGAEWVSPEEALFAEADVVAPCALGAVLDHETVPQLRCAAIAGAANNQLASEEVGDLIARRGILWAPDFVANAGGVINISVELEPGGYAPERAEQRVRTIERTLRQIFATAEREGTTPLAAAMALAKTRLAEAQAGPAGLTAPA